MPNRNERNDAKGESDRRINEFIQQHRDDPQLEAKLAELLRQIDAEGKP